MSESGVAGEIFNTSSGLLQPSMAASVCKTFRKLTAVVLFIAWQLALPIELILHRRVGKRYMNTFFFVISLIVLTNFAEAVLSGVRLARSSGPTQKAAQLGTAPVKPPAPDPLGPFGALTGMAGFAFVCHYLASRRRFGTEQQGHSLDPGVSWLVYPPFAAIALRPLARSWRARAWIAAGDPSIEPNPRRLLAYPASQLHAIAGMIKRHLALLSVGAPPHGPLNWLCITVAEPLAIGLFGATLLRPQSGHHEFGVYLCLVAVAMLIKGSIHAADWRERIYDDMDARLESQALSSWRSGKPMAEISSAFTVPVASCMPRSTASSPAVVGIPPGFEQLMAGTSPDAAA